MINRQAEFVEHVIEYAVAQPPSRSGWRLRSERDLESMLGVGRRQINEALNRLAQRGVLSRQRGSGTFVRKTVNLVDERAEQLRQSWEQSELQSPSQLFAQPSTFDARNGDRRKQQLHLALWGDWLDGKAHHQATLAEMVRCVQAAGHILTVHSIVQEHQEPLSEEMVRRQLEASHCDGYLVVSRWSDLFMRSIPDPNVPIVFCGGGRWDNHHQPKVLSDSGSAIKQGVDMFCESGFERIALLALYEVDPNVQYQRLIYHRAMEDHGLDYRAEGFVPAQTLRVGAPFRELMDRPDPPEALMVADDHLIPGLTDAMAVMDMKVGRDLGLIALTNHGITRIPDPSWSRLEVDPRAVGRYAVESLLELIESGNPIRHNLVIQARWLPGTSHLKPAHMGKKVPETAMTEK